MAKRRGFFRRARSSVGKHYRSAKRSGLGPTGVILPALGYGAARQYLSNLAAPLTSMIPAGQYADELLFGAAGYYLAKKGGSTLVKQLGMAALTVEAASVGHQLIGGGMGSGSSSGSIW